MPYTTFPSFDDSGNQPLISTVPSSITTLILSSVLDSSHESIPKHQSTCIRKPLTWLNHFVHVVQGVSSIEFGCSKSICYRMFSSNSFSCFSLDYMLATKEPTSYL